MAADARAATTVLRRSGSGGSTAPTAADTLQVPAAWMMSVLRLPPPTLMLVYPLTGATSSPHFFLHVWNVLPRATKLML